MNQEKRDIVNKQLKEIFHDEEIYPLYFSSWDKEDENVFKKNPFGDMSLIDSIIECLYLNKGYCSVNSYTNQLETYPGHNRSVIDIWRHLKYYNPELTIFEVMSCLYDYIMNEEYEDSYRISTFICSDIHRRVFILDDVEYYVHDKSILDKLYIDFYGWDNI